MNELNMKEELKVTIINELNMKEELKVFSIVSILVGFIIYLGALVVMIKDVRPRYACHEDGSVKTLTRMDYVFPANFIRCFLNVEVKYENQGQLD